MAERSSAVILPGDEIDISDFNGEEKTFTIGPGLKVMNSKIRSNRCGILQKRKPTAGESSELKSNAAWLEYHQKRYVPVLDDVIVGQIVQKTSDSFKIDFGAADLANLSALNFEGATKRNKPNIKIGDLVYARLTQTIEPELTCIGSSGVHRCLGTISQGGFLIRQNSNVTKKLLMRDFPLLTELGKEIPFEICIGANGWIWIKAHNVKETILISKAVELSEFLHSSQVKPMVKRWVDRLRGF